MASLSDLVRLRREADDRMTEVNPFVNLARGVAYGMEEKRQADIEQRNALALIQKKLELDQQQEIAKENRKNQELKRKFDLYREFKSQENRTGAGTVEKVASGDKGTALQRKATVIPRTKVTGKIDLMTGEPSLVEEDKSPMELLQEEISYGFYSTPQEIVKRGMELGADPTKLEALATTAAIPGVIGDQPQEPLLPEGMRSTGYEYKFGQYVPKGAEPIPASEKKAEQEMKEAAQVEAAKSEQVVSSANSVIDTIDFLKENKRYFGSIGGRAPSWMSPADPKKAEWESNFGFLEANKIKDVLNEMKSQSKTGATGFGALNAQELAVITNASMKLKKYLDEPTAEKYLNEMRNAFEKIVQREQGASAVTSKVPEIGQEFNGAKVISVKRIK